jgi:hypothetical protein
MVDRVAHVRRVLYVSAGQGRPFLCMLVAAGCEVALRDGETKTDVHLHGAIQRY